MLRCTSDSEASTGPGSVISNGDAVIVYLRHDALQAVVVEDARIFDCRYGAFNMKEWVGKQFGSRVVSRDQRGFIFLLAPTPELWTLVLRHRTQILYAADISLITCFLELRPGSKVLESGTGSGSLTTALARAVAPGGRVCTFDFHASRVAEAAQEFAANGLSDYVSVQERDIERLGFPEEHRGEADAVFLDLPGPWKAVPSAAECLKGDGIFCSFSPCIEQVQRTCGALSQAGFHSLRTLECLLRYQEVQMTRLADDPFGPQLPKDTGNKNMGRKRQRLQAEAVKTAEVLSVKPAQEAKGHTGYLVFARRIIEENNTALPTAVSQLTPEDNTGPSEA